MRESAAKPAKRTKQQVAKAESEAKRQKTLDAEEAILISASAELCQFSKTLKDGKVALQADYDTKMARLRAEATQKAKIQTVQAEHAMRGKTLEVVRKAVQQMTELRSAGLSIIHSHHSTF